MNRFMQVRREWFSMVLMVLPSKICDHEKEALIDSLGP